MTKPELPSFDELVGGGTSMGYMQFSESQFEAVVANIEARFNIRLRRSPNAFAALSEQLPLVIGANHQQANAANRGRLLLHLTQFHDALAKAKKPL